MTHATVDRADAPSLIGTRHECQCCGRIARITGEYDDGPGETGYEYEFEGPGNGGRRWISTLAASVRFRRVGDDGATVATKLRASCQSDREALRAELGTQTFKL